MLKRMLYEVIFSFAANILSMIEDKTMQKMNTSPHDSAAQKGLQYLLSSMTLGLHFNY